MTARGAALSGVASKHARITAGCTGTRKYLNLDLSVLFTQYLSHTESKDPRKAHTHSWGAHLWTVDNPHIALPQLV